jgi:Cys-rich repeat protein
VITTTHATCGECATDDDCASGEVCGVDSLDKQGVRAARVCSAPKARTLGELCAADAECESGACNQGACSECNATHACKGGATCGVAAEEWLTAEASLCDPGAARRKPGQACTSDGDCLSGTCNEPDAICQLCVDRNCEGMRTDDCGFLRRLAGTCR